MGLLDDIKKLRERADTLNNSLKSPQGRIEDASAKLSRTQFENKFKDYKHKAAITEESPLNPHPADFKASTIRKQKIKKNSPSNFFQKTLSESSTLKISKETELKENFYNSFNIKILLIMSALLIVFLLFKIEGNFLGKHNTQNDSKAQLNNLSSKTVPNDNNAYYLSKGLMICSGSYNSLEAAELQLNRIKKITEQDSKIIKVSDYYTIQIGDYYFDKDDAFYVFGELSAMGIMDISIRSN
jgi:zona occludens toxin (predicted ATPase)